MREQIEFVYPQTMDEAIRKARMCYQQSKAKGEGGKSWQPKKNEKNNSNFKSSKSGNSKGAARNSISNKFGRNHQRIKWLGEEKSMEASSKLEQGQTTKPPLQCWGCGEAHYYKNCPQ